MIVTRLLLSITRSETAGLSRLGKIASFCMAGRFLREGNIRIGSNFCIGRCARIECDSVVNLKMGIKYRRMVT